MSATDERSQAIQIGAVLLFGILIVLFASYQAFVVPAQNSAVEFNHNQRVQNDMVDVRNELLSTYTTGEDGFAEVELGTQFPPRLIALNPTPPTGTLRTGEKRPIVIEEQVTGDDITDDVLPGNITETRTVNYSPQYAAFDGAGTIRYENSLLYHDFGDGFVRLTDQQLVRGDTVQIVPIPTEFQESGRRTVSVEPRAGLTETSSVEDVNVTVPTELSEERWEEILEAELDPANVHVEEGPQGRNLTLELDGTFEIDAGPVGLGEVPGDARGGGLDEINPASPGDITLDDESLSSSTVTLTFNNTADTNNFTRARINFYNEQSNKPNDADVSVAGEPVSATLTVEGDFETLDPKMTLEAEATTDVTLTFNRELNPNDWFVITFELETGESALYFVSLKS